MDVIRQGNPEIAKATLPRQENVALITLTRPDQGPFSIARLFTSRHTVVRLVGQTDEV